MRLIAKFKLASRNRYELRGLLREAFNALAASEAKAINAGTHWHPSKTSKIKSIQGGEGHLYFSPKASRTSNRTSLRAKLYYRFDMQENSTNFYRTI